MTQTIKSTPDQLDPRTREFYRHAMELLDDARVPYLVGGAYSLAHHAGIIRHTKDLDLFIQRRDFIRVVDVMRAAGFRTEMIFPHWLGKVFYHDAFVDLIFGSGNGLCNVDDEWFAHSAAGEALDRPARLCPAEEIIWTKAFVQERERFDGADIAHLLLARGPQLDWERLLRRFRTHERVLLAHLLLFGYIYPSHLDSVPQKIIEYLLHAVGQSPQIEMDICRGTLLSREQYLIDVQERGFIDGRLQPHGRMTEDLIRRWTNAIDTA